MNHKVFICAAFIALISLLSTGCGDSSKLKTDKVTGKITLNGEIVAGASVIFSPVVSGGEAKGAIGTTDDKGVYQLQTLLGAVGAGTTPGEYKVTVTKDEVVPTGKTITDGSGETYDETKVVSHLPVKYAKDSTSGLTATVVAGQSNVFDFDLTP